jgi:hydrogenase nickel incorporation protein HypA/HybF
MHELAIVDSILKVVLKTAAANDAQKVLAVSLRIGEMTDLVDEWVQRYFDFLSKDTVAAGALLKIQRTPVVLLCGKCATSFPVDIRQTKDFACPACGGKDCSVVSGREFYISNIEVV